MPGRTAWRALAYFNLYRFLVAFLFVALYWIGQLPEPLGIYDETLFAVTTHVYLVFTVFAHLLVHIQKPPYNYQVFGQVLMDIICITLMMYASNGLNSGFGMLLVITVAGGGLLSTGKIGILYAAMATIAVLGHEIYVHLFRDFPPPNYTHAGFLGVTFFFTALVSQALASRVEESEALAQRRGEDLVKLARLNENIVQRLQSGIVVLNEDLDVSLVNESAKRLLGIDVNRDVVKIADYIPARLSEIVRNWKTSEREQSLVFKSETTGLDIQASIVPLRIEQDVEILIFIDDLALFRQRAQQLKLASLGRLTASIAHEVRNPLGAISHAGQLLSESTSLALEDKRLTDIIRQHSLRVNQIIENVMSLSRREQATPAVHELGAWLNDFRVEYESRHNLSSGTISLTRTDEKIYTKMDSLQLHQVLWNLVENGIRYSKSMPLIELNYGVNRDTERPYIDIRDSGPGIDVSEIHQLFEPFYTTEVKGTGLGLYLARELCEANQATLNLQSNTSAGCCFRIVFSHPDKQHMVK